MEFEKDDVVAAVGLGREGEIYQVVDTNQHAFNLRGLNVIGKYFATREYLRHATHADMERAGFIAVKGDPSEAALYHVDSYRLKGGSWWVEKERANEPESEKTKAGIRLMLRVVDNLRERVTELERIMGLKLPPYDARAERAIEACLDMGATGRCAPFAPKPKPTGGRVKPDPSLFNDLEGHGIPEQSHPGVTRTLEDD